MSLSNLHTLSWWKRTSALSLLPAAQLILLLFRVPASTSPVPLCNSNFLLDFLLQLPRFVFFLTLPAPCCDSSLNKSWLMWCDWDVGLQLSARARILVTCQCCCSFLLNRQEGVCCCRLLPAPSIMVSSHAHGKLLCQHFIAYDCHP